MPYVKNSLYLAVLAAASTSYTALAQSEEGNFILEEVFVTAEKREAGLQDTAIAVTALDAQILERSNIEDTLDLQFAVPNLMVTGQNNANFTLRGVGLGSLGGGADPAVGQAFNSMPINPVGENYDLERIEVLRGPQGTLFGRNTTGGVINVISVKPADSFSADLTAQVANFNSIRTKGAINLPLTNVITQRIAFYTVRRDGYTENVFLDTDVDGRDEISVRSSTRFEFSDSVDATLVLQYYNEDSDRQAAMKTACKPDTTIGCAVDTGDTIGYPADYTPIGDINSVLLGTFPVPPPFPSFPAILRPDRYADNPNPDDYRKVSIETNPETETEEFFAALEVNIDLSDELTLTSATAYVEQDSVQFRDWDLAAAPNAFFNTPGDPNSGLGGSLTYYYDGELQTRTDYAPVQRNIRIADTFSQEFRLASFYGGAFNFLAGMAYNTSDINFLGITWLPSLHAPASPHPFFGPASDGGGFNTLVDIKNESLAVFGEVYYDLTEDLALTAGLRYTEDKKTTVQGINPVGPAATTVKVSAQWEEFTGKLNLNWNVDLAFTDESMLYGTLSRGYKGGGLNPGNPISETFDPEYVNAIEIGSKNRLIGNRMQLNMAAFYYDYQDYQVGGLINGVATNFNAESVKVQGLEIESMFLATENFLINANASFLDTEIVDSDPLVNVSLGTSTSLEDVEGNELPNAPQMSFNVGAQYTHSLSDDLDLRFRVDYYWQDEFQGREFDNFTFDSWDRTDVYLTLMNTLGSWEVEAFVKNVTDDDGITSANVESNLAGLFRKLNLLDPRTYGVEVTYRWD